jgi:hypothetical protein
VSNLAEALPEEIARVRGVQAIYKELRSMSNVIVEPQIAMMEHAIREATKACAAGDVIAMLRWYEELKGWEE